MIVVIGSYSGWSPVSSRVPQGPILGPLLSLLYVDDLPRVCKFADDVLLYFNVNSMIRIASCCKLTFSYSGLV